MKARNTLLSLITTACVQAVSPQINAEGALMSSTSIAVNDAIVRRPAVPAQALDVIAFWRDAGPAMWFAKDAAFDTRFRDRFASLFARAARDELASWEQTPQGTLALLILLDQYPRNAFRNTPKMYATDTLARRIARAAVARQHVTATESLLRMFYVLPFGHSEELADQDFAVQLAKSVDEVELSHAEHHREIVKRFGRFPHRNAVLGRPSTAEEIAYLANGGYKG